MRLHRQACPGWPSVRSPVWPGLLLTLTSAGLLVSFHQVVRGAVLQGESRRQAVATLAHAQWQCRSMPGLRLRESCLVGLNAIPGDGVALSVRDIVGIHAP